MPKADHYTPSPKVRSRGLRSLQRRPRLVSRSPAEDAPRRRRVTHGNLRGGSWTPGKYSPCCDVSGHLRDVGGTSGPRKLDLSIQSWEKNGVFPDDKPQPAALSWSHSHIAKVVALILRELNVRLLGLSGRDRTLWVQMGVRTRDLPWEIFFYLYCCY